MKTHEHAAQLAEALRAIVKITDGTQPIDHPGALMVAQSALAAWNKHNAPNQPEPKWIEPE